MEQWMINILICVGIVVVVFWALLIIGGFFKKKQSSYTTNLDQPRGDDDYPDKDRGDEVWGSDGKRIS